MSRLANILTGINPQGGGFDEFGNPIQSLIPGGGALAGAAQIGAGFLDIASANKEMKRQQDMKRAAQKRADAARGKLDSFEFDVSQAQRDLATAGIRPTDLSPMQSLQATELAALSTDPRALMGGLGASTTRAQRGLLAAQQADLGRELGAMKGLADLEQSALEKKQDLQLGLQQQDYEMGLMDRAMAQQNIEAARQAKRDAISGIVGGAVGIASAGLYKPAKPQKKSTDLSGGFYNSFQKSFLESGGLDRDPKTPYKLGGKVKYGHGGKMNEGVLIAILEEGGMNAPVTKLEGEFDHSTNKKAIIDEETGVKEAEATGGEYILNPEQGEEISMAYKGIEQIVDSGEEPTMDQLMALYEAVRSVFSQPQFNEA
tara:strand:- start:10990 stop:12108 length:1119 start_codon:yes stop_codon:yes gene_type:complete